MKRIGLLLLMLLLICISAFSADIDLHVGVAPYGFQRSYFFYPDKNFINSKYAFGAEVGISYSRGGAFLLSSDLMFTDYLFGHEAKEQILTASVCIGLQSKPKRNVSLLFELGVGGSLCHFDGLSRLYLEVPVELGASYHMDDTSKVFLKVRDDVVLLFSKDLKYSSLSLIITPVLGYSRSL